MKPSGHSPFYDLAPEQSHFFEDVRRHLQAPQKSLPVKYLYDDTGIRLFDQWSRTDEYYPARCELEIMRRYAREMAADIGERCLLIEYGCDNGEKLKLLLNHLADPSGYVMIDHSVRTLRDLMEQLHSEYPYLDVFTVCADFTKLLPLPVAIREHKRKVIYFPGSEIGELHQQESRALLRNMRLSLNRQDGVLIGIDLRRDEAQVQEAYDDKTGYAQAFNRNILYRINRELEGNFQPDWFEHRATFNPDKNRLEMSLVSRFSHFVNIWDEQVSFYAGENIHTLYAHKYELEEFIGLAQEAGFNVGKYWTDTGRNFAVIFFTVKPPRF